MTIKVFAIRHQQICEGLGNPFTSGVMPQLEYVLLGVKKGLNFFQAQPSFL